ncbi:hypothetical protein AAGG74_10195 [Bacillus mexicanus]|uniref:hypothetical protein n=1 Tax=Bacillus mexicanus TaxID=2834415 RepID=UPI003D25695A
MKYIDKFFANPHPEHYYHIYPAGSGNIQKKIKSFGSYRIGLRKYFQERMRTPYTYDFCRLLVNFNGNMV